MQRSIIENEYSQLFSISRLIDGYLSGRYELLVSIINSIFFLWELLQNMFLCAYQIEVKLLTGMLQNKTR